jgi:hypothetical protein
MTEFRDSYLSRAKKAAPRAPLLPRPGTMLAAIAALEAQRDVARAKKVRALLSAQS